MTGHERYAEWDGAYVMGALSRAEREEYERHLAACPRCTSAVAELGPLPGLLSRVPDTDAEVLLALPHDPGPPPYLTERTLAAARAAAARPWWQRTRARVAAAALAAAVLVAGVAVPWALREDDTPPETAPAPAAIELEPVVESPLSARVALTSEGWGTRVDLTCEYAGDYGTARTYSLYVVDRAGRAGLVSTWRAAPGETARTSGSTDLAVDDIASVELRGSAGEVLLSATVD